MIRSEALPFRWPVRVYYEDTDAGGVVYHANYLNFMERSRTEWLRALGFEQTLLRQEYHVLMVVRSVQVEYFAPALFNDTLEVTVELAKRGRSFLSLSQTVLRADEQLAQATVKVVCVRADTFRPCAIPTAIVNEIESN